LVSAVVIFLILSSSPFAWGFGLSQHTEITRDGLWFLRPYVLHKIIEGNLAIDYPTIDIAGEHFDACSWDDASENIQDRYEEFRPWWIQGATTQFGGLLHAVQDFYSHSNWVELGMGGRLLVEHSGNWPDLNKWTNVSPYPGNQVFLAQDDEPWEMSGGIEPELRRQGVVIGHALITDSRPGWQAGDDCPDNVEDIEHDQINKDGPTNTKYAGDLSEYPFLHTLAKDTAAKATFNEWCRLLHYAHSIPLYDFADPYESTSRLIALWVDKDKSPYGCQNPPDPKNVKMKAEVTSIQMLNDRTRDGPANWNLVFAMYTGNFGQSVRKQTEVVSISEGEFWPSDKLPSPIVDCVSRASTIDNPKVLTVQGWRDGKNLHRIGVISEDDFLAGTGTTVYRPTSTSNSWPTGQFTVSDPVHGEFAVTIKVSFLPTLPGVCSYAGTGTGVNTGGGTVRSGAGVGPVN
jgi:hypothetical protein